MKKRQVKKLAKPAKAASINSAVWRKAIEASADPERTRHFFDLLLATEARAALEKASPEQAAVLAALLSGSDALSNWLVSHPQECSRLEADRIKFPRRKQGLQQEINAWLEPALAQKDYSGALTRIRQFKQQEMLRIATRDLAHLSKTPEIILEISDAADVCLDTVWHVCLRQMVERHGQPFHQDPEGGWHPTTGCVLGLGKLGGQELNYSSDVDVVFLYSDEGNTFREAPLAKPAAAAAPRPVIANHQFFNRLAEAFIAEVTKVTPEGVLFRIDLRLRPEGDSGPLSRSLSSYENYYAQWGQTWERMMLLKARGVAGDPTLAAEFLETVHSFRYPRSVNESVLSEVAAMKDRIENEVVRAGELERNVKLGRGGIREIEFTVQALQLLHAGRQPFLQGAQTLPCLQKLVQYELLSREDSRALAEAYCFLRDVEHRLQMEDNRQTHTVPTAHRAVERLARLMGFKNAKSFEAERLGHMERVRAIFDRQFKSEAATAAVSSVLPEDFEQFEAQWRELLAKHGFRDVDKALRTLREFVDGPGFVHVSPRTRKLASGLLPRLFALCKGTTTVSGSRAGAGSSPEQAKVRLSDPDRVLTRLDGFISAYGARPTLFELWHSNPAIFELLLLLFDRSEFLAELAIRTPDLVDELVTSGRLRQRKTATETLRDLRHGLGDADQHLWLRRYHQTELMRIGLRDILGLADFEQYLTELSALADACLQYAVEVVMRKHRLKAPPFVIIGLGKLGGAEIDYGSDLDILFVADSKARDITKLAKLALEVTDLVSSRTEHGMLFHTDARLRPDGEKGLLVNTLKSYETYYRSRALLWEIQTLTRTRPVAGDLRLGEQFQKMAAEFSDFSQPQKSLAAATPDWKDKIRAMRLRIEKERTPAGKNDLAIKTGAGGLMDAEFIAQTLCMSNGWQEANTLRSLERGRESGALPDADKLIENYRRLRRVEGILRRWSYEGETVLPDDPAPYYRVSVRCGFDSPEAFREALKTWRQAIREVYDATAGTRRC